MYISIDKKMSSLVYYYQDIWNGEIQFLPHDIWYTEDWKDQYNNDLAIKFLREYVFEKTFGWTKEDILANFNESVIKKYKLTPVIKKIMFPPEMSKYDYSSYAYVLYPNNNIDEMIKMALHTYDLYRANKIRKLDFEFFTEPKNDYGKWRSIYCLAYAIINDSRFSRYDSVYLKKKFKDESGKRLLKKYKLTIPVDCMEFESPQDYLDAMIQTDMWASSIKSIEK